VILKWLMTKKTLPLTLIKNNCNTALALAYHFCESSGDIKIENLYINIDSPLYVE